KGTKNGIKQDFGVITDKGILGIIDQTSKNYATVLSVLNSESNISAQLKKSNQFGTLKWDGKSPISRMMKRVDKELYREKKEKHG
ncbi:hypothetical protein MUP35_02385, partial [Patescibacteria group bacterium]|nr:hypothetical protein [Patescibacteria group bacterium]